MFRQGALHVDRFSSPASPTSIQVAVTTFGDTPNRTTAATSKAPTPCLSAFLLMKSRRLA